MKTFYAQLSDGSSIKRQADTIEIKDNAILVYKGGKIEAYIDLGVVLYAQIYDRKGSEDGRRAEN